MTAWVQAIIGTAVLFLGRKLYWLFVGGVGFVVGTILATRYLGGQPAWVTVLVALACGLLGALFTTFLQRFAVAMTGFISAGLVSLGLVQALGADGGWIPWAAFIVAGFVGGVLVFIAFDWALIILSSLTGASLIVQATGLASGSRGLWYTVLTVLGIVVQAVWMWRTPGEERPDSA
jgi:drug/metabolite transporter (DMT)-like permease